MKNNLKNKKIKHSLKTDIDSSETWILLALIGDLLEANQKTETVKHARLLFHI